MDKQELKNIETRLHNAVTSAIYNCSAAAGDKSNYCYWNMLEEIAYINRMLALLK